MALTKQSLSLNFARGLDTKTDALQVQAGNFLLLENSVFTVGGQLSKRNGFSQLTALPSGSEATSITTYSGNLIALGNSLYSFNQSSNQWQNKGNVQPVSLTVQPLIRTAYSNSAPDTTVAPNGLALTVFLDGDGAYKYQIADSTTGQTIVPITLLPATATQARTFVLGAYFLITFLATVGPNSAVEYIAIPHANPTNPSSPTVISTAASSLTAGYDGVVSNNTFYIAWNGSDGGGAIRATYLTSQLVQANTIVLAGHTASLMTVTADSTGAGTVWITAYAATNAYTYARDAVLNPISGPTQVITSETTIELTSTAQNGVLSVFYEVSNAYSFDSSIRTDLVKVNTCTQAGVAGTPTIVIRSVGLASKAFLLSGVSYMLVTYGGPSPQLSFEPTYFLINQSGQIIARLALENGAGYATTQVLPSISLSSNTASIGYLYRDLIQALSTTQTTSQAGFYSQTGVNLVSFNLSETAQNTVEIGGTLCITGGFLWMYDGVKPVEQGFHLFPENIKATPVTGSGSQAAQQYYYQVVYEWTDGNGNIHRSAPSIPVSSLMTGTGHTFLNIPTLRLTYKTAPNGVRIVIYRWSVAQQTYFQITSVTAPLLNDPTVDSVDYTDNATDASILGNNILYTTGGVIENLPGPACDVIDLYDDRVWLVDAEDRNLLWFSKQVIEATPVEMSDLFTKYIAPTTGAQGSTGLLTALSPMDDKQILFKPNALAYFNGTGPDNTGANNQYSEPIFITSTIGTQNPKSIVFQPQGLMFDTNQGRWLLARNLGTEYIGAPVASFNSQVAGKALNIPLQNQIRFTLPDTTLVYDYFYGQWGTFVGIPAISSTIYQGSHTFLNDLGQVYQETEGMYADGAEPVLMSFTTSWFNLAGLQGFERAYFFFLLGQYISPHKLYLSIAYDYNPSPSQSMVISPDNYAPPYGSDAVYGASSPYGGLGSIEWWRVFFQQGKCTSFQITLQEVYDSVLASTPGAGFTLSGLNLIFGAKGNYPRLSASRSIS